jgi:hypothetical protein
LRAQSAVALRRQNYRNSRNNLAAAKYLSSGRLTTADRICQGYAVASSAMFYARDEINIAARIRRAGRNTILKVRAIVAASPFISAENISPSSPARSRRRSGTR